MLESVRMRHQVFSLPRYNLFNRVSDRLCNNAWKSAGHLFFQATEHIEESLYREIENIVFIDNG